MTTLRFLAPDLVLEWIYRVLLYAYPAEFRRRYGDDLLQALRDRRREARFSVPVLGVLRLWAYILWDWFRSAPLLRLRSWERSASASPQPRSPKRRSSGQSDRWYSMESMLRDLRQALRLFRRHPSFAALTVLTLALGIGASTAIFSVFDSVFLRPLPYEAPHRLAAADSSVSPLDFRDWQERNTVFESLAASRLERVVTSDGGAARRERGAGVSARFFDLLGVSPLLGRGFLEEDDRPEADAVALISHGYWMRRFGGTPAALGSVLRLNQSTFTVIGILPPDFLPLEGLYQNGVDIWFPLAFVDDDLNTRNRFMQVLGRLREGVELEQANRSMAALSEEIASEIGQSSPSPSDFRPLQDMTVGEGAASALLLMAASGLLILIGCANAANLSLSRALERRREVAMRMALGAGRTRLARQLMVESLLLAVAAGICGSVLAFGAVQSFLVFNPGGIPRIDEVSLDLRALGFALAVSLATGMLFGLAPALGATRSRIGDALKSGEGRSTAGRGRQRLRSGLIVVETALAILLLTGAALLTNSFVRLSSVDPGFEPEGAVSMEVALTFGYETAEARRQHFGRLLQRLSQLPGAESAGATHSLPLDGNTSQAWLSPEGLVLPADRNPPEIYHHNITPGYFQAMGVRLLAGRDFSSSDQAGSPLVAVINRTLAEQFWPGQGAVGKRLKFGRPESDRSWIEVVGVVSDIKQYGLDQEAVPEIYFTYLQSNRHRMHFVVRTSGESAAMSRMMRQAATELDPNLPVQNARPLDEQVSASIVRPRFYMLLLGSFALAALGLACVGLYGSLSYLVRQRRRELGIRLALGAGHVTIMGLVVGRGMALAAAGIALGMAAAAAASRLLEGYVFAIGVTDPTTYGLAALCLSAVALLACCLPARRAVRVDPAATLRIG